MSRLIVLVFLYFLTLSVAVASSPWHGSATIGSGGGTPLTSFPVAGAGDFHTGVGFAKGTTTGCGNVASPDPLNYQVTGVSTWSDGSCRFAIMAGKASGAGTLHINTGTSPGGTALTCASITSANPAAQVVFTGNVSGTVALSSLFASPKLTWESGAAEVDCLYWTTIGYTTPSTSRLRVAFDVRLYADNNVCVRVMIDNGGWVDNSQEDVTYSPTVTILGSTAYAPGTITHYAWTGYDLRGCSTSEAATTPNATDLVASKLIPNYSLTTPPSSTALNALVQTYTPFSQGPWVTDMEQTGGRPDIGPLAEWDADYFTSLGDSRAQAAVAAAWRALRTYPHVCLDHSNGDGMALPSQNTTTNCDGGTGGWATPYPCSSQIGSGSVAICWDNAHHPSSGYVGFILTGEYAAYEQLEATALVAGFLHRDNGNGGSFPTRNWFDQTRADAWDYRTVGQFLAVTPSNQMKTDLTTEMAYQLSQDATMIGVNSIHVFYSHEVAACDYCGAGNPANSGYGAPWQQDFMTMSLNLDLDLNVMSGTAATNLSNLAQEASLFTIGRFGNGTNPNGCYSQGASYNAEFATGPGNPNSGLYLTTFYAVWQGAVATGWQNGGTCTNTLNGPGSSDPSGTESYFANAWPALETAVDQGWAGAAIADSLWRGTTNYASVFFPAVTGNEPTWGIFHR